MTEDLNYSFQYQRWHHTDEAYFRQWHESSAGSLVRLVGANKSAKILDVGCGFGLVVYSLLSSGYANVVGIDIDQHQIAVANSLRLPCSVVSPDNEGDFFSATQGNFDAILMFDVLEHISKDRQVAFLKRLRESLQPNGILIVRVPNALSPTALYHRYMDYTHCCSFTLESLEFVLHNSGFSTVQMLPASDFSLRAVLKSPWLLFRYGLVLLTRTIWRAAYVGDLGRPALSFPLTRNLMVRASCTPVAPKLPKQ